ncbi:hypothetical protein SB7C_12400, partial [Staphylococcus epidermidis]
IRQSCLKTTAQCPAEAKSDRRTSVQRDDGQKQSEYLPAGCQQQRADNQQAAVPGDGWAVSVAWARRGMFEGLHR